MIPARAAADRGGCRGMRPAANPVKDSTPTMKPCQKPKHARTAANATMIQSSCVTCHVLPLLEPRIPPQRLRRARPVIAMAGVAFAIGAIVGANHTASSAHALARRFVARLERRATTRRCTRTSTPPSRQSTSIARIRRRLPPGPDARPPPPACASTGKPRDLPGGEVAVPVRVHTRLFGTLQLRLRAEDRHGRRRRHPHRLVALARLPGPAPGRAAQPPHDPAAARDAARPRRDGAGRKPRSRRRRSAAGRSARPQLAARRTGERGARHGRPDPRLAARQNWKPKGCRPNAIVGVSGLERALDDRLRGTPGGELLAGTARARIRRSPARARAVRTHRLPRGAARGRDRARRPARRDRRDAALHRTDPGGRGHRPRQRCSRRDRRSRWSRSPACCRPTSPPRTRVFPYATYATLDGVKLNNANGEECGGTLELAFAVSCNSVFAPLGVKLGAARLVATAERFGFNQPPGIAGRRREHAAGGRADPGRTRRRIDGHRPGPGAGERPADGHGRRHDRRRRPPADADLRAGRAAGGAARRRSAPRSRARCAT